MKKQLPTSGITNELAESSVFFAKPKVNAPSQELPAITEKPDQKPAIPQQAETKLPRHHDTVAASNHTTEQPRQLELLTPTMLEEVRSTVKQIGKEAATHRFTAGEKQRITDLVYTYGRQGYKTSENEITRIAVNWLLLDYQEHGATSVLARLLDSLHR